MCFQTMQDYERALVCFKSLLHVAWQQDNFDFEMQAYEHISLQYYYLGLIDKSSQYHKRVVRGPDPKDRPKGYEAIKDKKEQGVPIS